MKNLQGCYACTIVTLLGFCTNKDLFALAFGKTTLQKHFSVLETHRAQNTLAMQTKRINFQLQWDYLMMHRIWTESEYENQRPKI